MAGLGAGREISPFGPGTQHQTSTNLPANTSQQASLWGLILPGAGGSSPAQEPGLPLRAAWAIAGTRSAHRVTARPPPRLIDARGSLEVRAPPARPSAQPTAHIAYRGHPASPDTAVRPTPDTWREKGSDKMESQRGGTSRWRPLEKTQSGKNKINKAQGIHPRNKNPESPTFGLGVASWSCVFSDPRIQHPSSSIIPVSRDIVHFFS